MQLIKKCSWPLILSFFFMLMMTVSGFSAEADPNRKADSEKPSHYVAVTYFHSSFRCMTCRKIEEFSKDAVQFNFEKELKSGKLIWQTINVDEPENKHYIKEYQLYTKSLIVSEVRDGKEVRWKNLKNIWTLVRSKEKFEGYVTTEIKEWLKE
ncbi:MAG: nitrophenyl compound nitroreductase subunit ArsF family protein [Desulfobacterales bacterium]